MTPTFPLTPLPHAAPLTHAALRRYLHHLDESAWQEVRASIESACVLPDGRVHLVLARQTCTYPGQGWSRKREVEWRVRG